jgi:hypothetical protein
MGRADGTSRLSRTVGYISVSAVLILIVFLWQAANHGNQPLSGASRPVGWAVPLAKPGLPNLYQVSPTLYRCAQPMGEGVVELQRMGIRTVVNFRESDSDTVLFAGSGIVTIHLPMAAFFPERAKLARFLEIAGNSRFQPVLVHCRHGSDRTGAAVALYRIKTQGWPVSNAVLEMIRGGFGFHYWHSHLKGFVSRF